MIYKSIHYISICNYCPQNGNICSSESKEDKSIDCLKMILLYGMKNDLNYERISIMWISSRRKGQSKYQIDSQISTNTSFQNDQSYNICNNFNFCWNHKYVALKTEWRTNKINEIRFDGRNQNTKVNKQTYKLYSFPVGS